MSHPDEVLQYEPIKAIYVEVVHQYPELVEIARTQEPKVLKPIIQFDEDLTVVQEFINQAYGSNSVHVAIQRPKAVDMRDSRFDDNKRSLL